MFEFSKIKDGIVQSGYLFRETGKIYHQENYVANILFQSNIQNRNEHLKCLKYHCKLLQWIWIYWEDNVQRERRGDSLLQQVSNYFTIIYCSYALTLQVHHHSDLWGRTGGGGRSVLSLEQGWLSQLYRNYI